MPSTPPANAASPVGPEAATKVAEAELSLPREPLPGSVGGLDALAGTVYLTGSGPGNPLLVTLRARRLIETCDVLVFDHLACPDALHWTKPGCRHYYVGKQAGAHFVQQDEIEALLVREAQAGKSVVRLKGGDPFVFGRGGEEAETLRQANVRYEVVPAVTSALAAAAYAGIPLTHRAHTSALVFLSGHEDPTKSETAHDWQSYGKLKATLCLYMATKHLGWICSELVKGGMPEDRPAAIIQWASTSRQRRLIATVSSIAEKAAAENIGPPSIVIIGDVVALGESLEWFKGL